MKLLNTSYIYIYILFILYYQILNIISITLSILYCNRLFVDKIMNHPQYNSVPTKDKIMNKHTLRIAIPKAEELKKQLLEQYQTELEKYLEDLKEREKIEKERLRREEVQRYTLLITFNYYFIY